MESNLSSPPPSSPPSSSSLSYFWMEMESMRILQIDNNETDGNIAVTTSSPDPNNNNNNNNNTTTTIIYDDSQVIRDTMMVYGSAMVVIVLVFCIVRRRFPRVYNLRSWVDDIQTPLAGKNNNAAGSSSSSASSKLLLAWMWKVYHVTDDEMLRECGMDALCFIRIAQMGFKLCAVGIFNAIWLMIVYATSQTEPETADIHDGLVQVTIAHVPSATPRLVAASLAAYIFFGYAMYLILEDLEWFTEMRHKFLKQARTRNYAVFIRNIPEGYRHNAALEEFMRGNFASHEAVVGAHVAVTTGQLAKVVTEREDKVTKLEHALAEYAATGKRPTHKVAAAAANGIPLVGGATAPLLGQQVDSIDTYQSELTMLNTDVAERLEAIQQRIRDMSAAAAAAAVVTQDEWATTIIEGGCQSQGIRSGLTNDDMGSITSMPDDMEQTTNNSRTHLDLTTVAEHNNNHNKDDSQHGKNRIMVMGGMLGNAATNVVGNTLGQAEHLASGAVKLLTGSDDGEAYPAGFVVFSKLSATNAALQMVHHSKPFSMEILEAPDPEDINWLNIARTHKDLQVGKLLSLGMTVTLCLLWTIPMTFIASLSSVKGLRDELEFIDDMLDRLPFLVPVFRVVAPLLVIIANSLLPVILEAVTLFEGPISGAVIQASLFVKLAAFMIIQTFFVSAVSGSIIDKISEMIDSPTMIVDLLATSLPQQATYFMQISFVSIVMSGGMELLRVVPVAMAIIRSCIGPRLTEKERRTTFLGIRPLYDPADFQHADFTSNAVFYFMVLFVYSVISPLTNFILAFCFLFLGTMLRHQFIYIYPTRPDSGGKIWTAFIQIIVTCMIVAQVTMLGLLGLKKGTIATPMFIPLLICTILFSYYIRQEHFRVAQFLPTRNCLQEDARQRLSESFLVSLKDAYLQPELKAEPNIGPEDDELEDPSDIVEKF